MQTYKSVENTYMSVRKPQFFLIVRFSFTFVIFVNTFLHPDAQESLVISSFETRWVHFLIASQENLYMFIINSYKVCNGGHHGDLAFSQTLCEYVSKSKLHDYMDNCLCTGLYRLLHLLSPVSNQKLNVVIQIGFLIT